MSAGEKEKEKKEEEEEKNPSWHPDPFSCSLHLTQSLHTSSGSPHPGGGPEGGIIIVCGDVDSYGVFVSAFSDEMMLMGVESINV